MMNHRLQMNRLLLPLIVALTLPSEVFSHHGPFSIENDSNIHQLHLGGGYTSSPTGEIKIYGVRACSTEELDFVRPWSLAKKPLTPFKLQTEDIVAFGKSGSINTGFRSGNAAGLVGAGAVGVIAMPIALPFALISSGGGNNHQYSIFTINRSNGRVGERNITLFSEKDVNYLNEYLKISTGISPGEQLTFEELKNKFSLLKDKPYLDKQINCSYMEKYGTKIEDKKKKKEYKIKSSIKVNCDSPVWKNKPRCN